MEWLGPICDFIGVTKQDQGPSDLPGLTPSSSPHSRPSGFCP